MGKIIRVMGFGTFDGIHPGHESFLRQLRSFGDEVIAVVARDRNVEKIKGRRPHFSERERVGFIKESGLADQTLLGNEEDFYTPLRQCEPDVIGLGYDQQADPAEIRDLFPKIKIVRLRAFEPEKYKSSLMRKTSEL